MKAGHSCLIYQFPVKILSNNIPLTEKYFKEIQEDIRRDIKNIKDRHDFEEIIVLGISLGCVNALMFANANPNVNKIILVVLGIFIIT